jgi:hypothetical protein
MVHCHIEITMINYDMIMEDCEPRTSGTCSTVDLLVMEVIGPSVNTTQYLNAVCEIE